MKVLILTGRFGMGHVSAAKSLEEQLRAEYDGVNTEVVDLMECTVPRLSKLIYGAFTFLTKHGRSLYNFLYRQAAKRDENEWTAFTTLSMKKLSVLIEDKQPDLIISTLPLSSLLVSKYNENAAKKQDGSQKRITLATCITDISSHSEWIQPNTDFYLVGDDLVRRQLVSRGVPECSILITGIPVRQAFLTPAEVRQGEPKPMKSTSKPEGKMKKLLIMGGGLGLLPKEPAFYQQLNQMEAVQTTVITGTNEKLYQALAGKYRNIRVIAYTERVDLYMKDADVVLTKPGGITLFETIFSGKPVLMFAPFLQQEVNNMHFALYHNIGRVLSKKKNDWAQQIGRLMSDDGALEAMTQCVAALRSQYDGSGLRQVVDSCGRN